LTEEIQLHGLLESTTSQHESDLEFALK